MADSPLKVHNLRPAPGAKTAKTRVGRGEASKGKTAGRGTKGTKARYQVPQRFEGGQMPLHMRLPKLKGFKNPFKITFQVVNLDKLAELYPQGGEVTVEDLVAKGAVRKNSLVKVLGTGDISVALQVSVDAVSGSAAEKITAAERHRHRAHLSPLTPGPRTSREGGAGPVAFPGRTLRCSGHGFLIQNRQVFCMAKPVIPYPMRGGGAARASVEWPCTVRVRGVPL